MNRRNFLALSISTAVVGIVPKNPILTGVDLAKGPNLSVPTILTKIGNDVWEVAYFGTTPYIFQAPINLTATEILLRQKL